MATSLSTRLDLTTLTMSIGNLPTDVPVRVLDGAYSDSLSRTRNIPPYFWITFPLGGAPLAGLEAVIMGTRMIVDRRSERP